MFSKISLAFKTALLTAGVTAVIAAGFSAYQISQARSDAELQTETEMATRSMVMAKAVEQGLEGGAIELSPSGKLLRLRAKALPKEGDHRVVDHAVSGSSLFVLDPASGDLVRYSSSVLDAAGKRQIGSRVPASSRHAQFVARGEAVTDKVDVAGVTRLARYIPIVGQDGKVLGAVGSGMTLSELENASQQKIMTILLVFGSFTILVGLMTFALLTWSLKPVRAIADGIDALVNDQTPQTAAFTKRGDEIGLIARSIETLDRSLAERREMRAKEDERMSGDSARRVRLEAAVSTFERALQKVVTQVESRSRSIGSATQSVSSSTDGAGSSARDTVIATDETLARVTGIAGATEELNSAIGEIRRQTEAAVNVSQDATRAVDAASTDVSGLAQTARKIGEVVSLIRAIAEQTNLLALNATIEAARAGESGRGFAVVASEVKQLASQTARATEDISSQVSAIQDATDRTVRSMDGISSTMVRMREASDAISGAIDQQVSATQEISVSVNRAADVAQTAGTSIGTVTHRLETVGSAVQSLNAVAGDLDTDVTDLRRAVETFLGQVKAA